MRKVYVVSDIWFNRPYGQYEGMSSSEYNDMIIENWNTHVEPDGLVYVLGGLGISDLYHLVMKLNGEIHILNNAYTSDEKMFLGRLKDCLEKSYDINLEHRIFIIERQMVELAEEDVILSYYPLSNWGGKDTGTIHIHGYDMNHDFDQRSFSAMCAVHDYRPICVKELVDTVNSVEEKIFKK